MTVLRWAAACGLTVALGCFEKAPDIAPGSLCDEVEVPEPTAACPAICNDGCVDGECQIACTAEAPCTGMLQCPEDFACDFDCAGEGACRDAQLVCPNDYPCSLTCEGAEACMGVELGCGFSTCELECGAPESACAATTVRCGPGECTGACVPGSAPVFESCANSCVCTPC